MGRLRVTCAYFANGPRIKNRLPCHGNFKEVGPSGERRPGIKNLMRVRPREAPSQDIYSKLSMRN